MKLSCARAVAALLVLSGKTLPVQAAAASAEVDDGQLDWTAGSVLGLQRRYVLHRRGFKPQAKVPDGKGLKPGAKTPDGAVPYSSLLGFQRGIKLQKVFPPPAEEAARTVELPPSV
mmetsp:Transcript_80870/g.255182  ORF Transcript_80870/g.255182 Transcript_80870/m.255182 type:complete len:116 (-) Transcript_80870:185-532(-)